MLWNPEKCQAWEAVAPFIFRYLPMGTGCGWQQHWDPLALGDVPWGMVPFAVPPHLQSLWLWQSWNCAVSQVFHRVSRCGCSQKDCLRGSHLSQALPSIYKVIFLSSVKE